MKDFLALYMNPPVSETLGKNKTNKGDEIWSSTCNATKINEKLCSQMKASIEKLNMCKDCLNSFSPKGQWMNKCQHTGLDKPLCEAFHGLLLKLELTRTKTPPTPVKCDGKKKCPNGQVCIGGKCQASKPKADPPKSPVGGKANNGKPAKGQTGNGSVKANTGKPANGQPSNGSVKAVTKTPPKKK